MMLVKYFLSTFLLLTGIAAASQAQSQAPPRERYWEEEYAPQRFEEAQWQKATEGLEYALQPRKPAPKKKQEERGSGRRSKDDGDENDWGNNAAAVFKFIAVAVIAFLVAFVIYQLVRNPRNKKIQPSALQLFAESMEENLTQEGLKDYIREAERQGQYALAIRFYYLSVLQELQQQQLIRWKKEKTNRDYVLELRRTPLADGFRFCTRVFDEVRYGEYLPDERSYRADAPAFSRLLVQIKESAAQTRAAAASNPAYHE